MLLAQKLQRSASDRRSYQRRRKSILERKRLKNASNRHVRALQRAICEARAELAFTCRPVATQPKE